MKLLNFFKKETKKNTTANVEKLEKNQLEKVIGGTDVVVGTTSEKRMHSDITISKGS
jgi:hypothetical protein